MGLFERYLTVWVGLGILAGVGLGLLTPATFAAIGLCYLPQLSSVLGFLRSGVAEPLALLSPSPRFLHELAGRWGAGRGAAAWLYEISFAAGVLAGMRAGRPSPVLLWWIACPIAVFSLVPFSKFFDARYLLPAELTRGKERVTVRFQPHPGNIAGGVFGLRTTRVEE